MLLKHIYLYLNLDEYPDELTDPFSFWTRYICNFLERRVRRLKFQTNGFSKICVQGTHDPKDACHIVSENALVATVAFDQDHFQSLSRDEYHEFFLRMLIDGLEKCAQHHSVPLKEILEAIDDFRRGCYINEWTHQTRLLRLAGLKASLLCSLTMERFDLILELDQKGKTIFKESILETKPDEIIFEHKFKEVVLEDDLVIVKDRFGKSRFSLELSKLPLRASLAPNRSG